jgi:hypothetical protein
MESRVLLVPSQGPTKSGKPVAVGCTVLVLLVAETVTVCVVSKQVDPNDVEPIVGVPENQWSDIVSMELEVLLDVVLDVVLEIMLDELLEDVVDDKELLLNELELVEKLDEELVAVILVLEVATQEQADEILDAELEHCET